MNVNKIARQDAHEWARAEMFFGAGAGTRRKLLQAEIEGKRGRIPGYADLFDQYYSEQNFADHAIAAAKERKRIDRMVALKKNTRGSLTGNPKSMSTGLLLVGAAYVFATQTGLDEILKEEAKRTYRKAKAFVNEKRKPKKPEAATDGNA